MISRMFSNPLNNNLEEANDDFDSHFLELIHRYILFLFFLFLFYSIFTVFFWGDVVSSALLILITFFFAFLMGIKGKINSFYGVLKTSITVVLIVLTFIVSFYDNYTSKIAGVEYFYFSILFALPFFFNYKEDYYSILLIVFIIAFNFIGCLYWDLDFLPKSKFMKNDDFKIVQLINIIFVITKFLMDMFFLHQKDKLIYGLIEEKRIKDSIIEDLVKANNELMERQIVTNNLTEDNISEILELAENGSPIFLERFKIYFPDFIPNILKINSDLISSELNICALMRLNFDTKKIALCTNSSVRAIESRKYRIRKKLGIPSHTNINNFILKI
ncbi:Two component regulator three Y domain-containing protein [Chryseobacterium piperi]|uniref:Two component regulator three Y domain-containing protein n=2 Tax=Chryseobacterium piperi TaxID=558152 RepID=A0A086BN11_9FLAO|nr:Two component regulator three Y domain-containing protein [Chryseobacterium piperi]